jgi:hypothetical protein
MLSERVTRVRELSEMLDFLPPQSRAEMADKLDGLGLRVQAELALPEGEISAIADSLYFLPPPARTLIAYQLRARGVTVHQDEATLQVEREGPKALGKHAPQRVVKKASMAEGMDMLRQVNPGLAARIDAAKTDPEVAKRIEEARSNADRDVIAKELGIDVAESLKVVKQEVDNVKPEDLE